MRIVVRIVTGKYCGSWSAPSAHAHHRRCRHAHITATTTPAPQTTQQQQHPPSIASGGRASAAATHPPGVHLSHSNTCVFFRNKAPSPAICQKQVARITVRTKMAGKIGPKMAGRIYVCHWDTAMSTHIAGDTSVRRLILARPR